MGSAPQVATPDPVPWGRLFTSAPVWVVVTMWLVSVLGGAAAAVTSWQLGSPAPVAAAALVLPALGAIDIACYRLPDPLVAAAAALAAAGAVVWVARDQATLLDLGFALGCSLAAFVFYGSVWWVAPPGAFGLGDVKLAAVCGFLLGTNSAGVAVMGALIVPAFIALALAVALGWFRHAVPYGPALAVGALVSLWFPDQLLDLLFV